MQKREWAEKMSVVSVCERCNFSKISFLVKKVLSARNEPASLLSKNETTSIVKDTIYKFNDALGMG